MRYQVTDSIKDIERIVALEIKVWGLKEIDAVPSSILKFCVHSGGVLIIAEDKAELVGFCAGLPARKNGEFLLWSHMTGVHPNYQGKGIGRQLKLKQRDWAKLNGYDTIGWTFDPFQSRNANFNLNVLGAYGMAYHENFYGIMNDAINSNGLPSDRLEIRWDITTPKTELENITPSLFLVDNVSDEPLIQHDAALLDGQVVGIKLPTTHTCNMTWLNSIRAAFFLAFQSGYHVTSFHRTNVSQYYVLTPS